MNPKSNPPQIGGPDDIERDCSNEGNSNHEETEAGYHADSELSPDIDADLVQ